MDPQILVLKVINGVIKKVQNGGHLFNFEIQFVLGDIKFESNRVQQRKLIFVDLTFSYEKSTQATRHAEVLSYVTYYLEV